MSSNIHTVDVSIKNSSIKHNYCWRANPLERYNYYIGCLNAVNKVNNEPLYHKISFGELSDSTECFIHFFCVLYYLMTVILMLAIIPLASDPEEKNVVPIILSLIVMIISIGFIIIYGWAVHIVNKNTSLPFWRSSVFFFLVPSQALKFQNEFYEIDISVQSRITVISVENQNALIAALQSRGILKSKIMLYDDTWAQQFKATEWAITFYLFAWCLVLLVSIMILIFSTLP